jgi:hypothetical protein
MGAFSITASLAAALALVVWSAPVGPSRAQTAEKTVVLPGSRIVMAPPPGFVRSEKMGALVGAQGAASIAASEALPGAFAQLRQSATRANDLRAAGLSLLDVETIPGFPYEHVLIHATRQRDKAIVDVWRLVFQHKDIAGTVTINVARVVPPPVSAQAVRAAMASVRVTAVANPAASLPFAVDAPQRFTYRSALGGRQLILKETPLPPEGAVDDAAVSIELVSRDPVAPAERDSFARQRMFALPGVLVDTADEPKPVTIGGLPALELSGRGVSASGQPRRVYLVVVFAPRQVYTITGVARPARFADAQADLRALAQSFKLK